MRTEDMILVSVDDHVIEPRDMFEGRLPAKYQDKAPKLERRQDGTDVWMYDGNIIPNVGLTAVVGRRDVRPDRCRGIRIRQQPPDRCAVGRRHRLGDVGTARPR